MNPEIVGPGCPRGIPGHVEMPLAVERLPNGNTLIADAGDEAGFGSEIVEVDPVGNIVWDYNEGLRFAHSGRRLRNGNTLITDTSNNRLIEVTPVKKIVISSDEWGGGIGKLSDGSHLHYPNEAFELKDGTFLVTDRNNDRCIQVDRKGHVIWLYDKEIKHPHNADPLPNGNILISDSDGNRILEVNRKKEIVWSYGDGSPKTLWWPRSAIRLENGNTLITDSKNHRIIEVSPDGKTIWKFQTEHVDKFYITHVTKEGTFLIACTDGHHQVIEIDRTGNIVWLFRNYRRPAPVYARLTNGFFKELEENGIPKYWVLATRLSEGGGRLIWDEDNKPYPCPGLEYDRPGALFLQQNIAAKVGETYRLGAEIKTIDVKGAACLHIDFYDDFGGSLYRDITEMPSGEYFTGTNDWTHEIFEVKVPPKSTFAQLRLAINHSGKVFIRNIMMNKI
ncbi:MAG: hypothetical protein COZ69_01490 [Deltaproteobacteria bacterium CG_4_8_14_3_um_filter_45_9]|nr:MAG: hypothetical protein COZ69_01490 [Deltaproteobacteria bacterium CG_4_8_14_3_um_filter_45_9]